MIRALLLFGLAAVLSGCSPKDPIVGGFYIVDNGDHSFSAVKVLEVDDGQIQLEQFSNGNGWGSRPEFLNMAAFLVVDDPRAPKISYRTLLKRGFWDMKPELFSQQDFTDFELDKYKRWKRNQSVQL